MPDKDNTPTPIASKEPVITIGAVSYPIRKFVTAKFIRAMSLVTQLVDSADVASLFGEDRSNAFIGILIKRIPKLLETGEPVLMKFCALTLTSNAKLQDLEVKDESTDLYLETFANDLRWNEDFTVDTVVDCVAYGIEQMGVSSFRKNFDRLRVSFQKI